MKYVAYVRCKQMFFVERSSASNGGSIHMARTSGWIDPLLDAPQKPSF